MTTETLLIKDKIVNALKGKENKILETGKIIDLVLKKYPTTNKTSVSPADYCFNRKNKGSSKYELFEYISLAKLKYLGEEEIKIIYPDDIQDETLPEGTKKTITVNTYERNPKARIKCITHYGTKCSICNFDFQKIYGEIGKGFIHVHHLKQLSEINDTYNINPIEDLRPVCPNCHAMLHKNTPAYSISEMKEFITKSYNKT